MKNDEIKEQVKTEIDERVKLGITEKATAEFLKKIIDKAEGLTEINLIQQLGDYFKKTGFHFNREVEKEINTDKICYFKKDNSLSFIQNKDDTDNLLVIGDNYKALLNLLICYKNKIKMIYIDPPYGKDSMGEFADVNYNNSLTRDDLLSMLDLRLRLAKLLLTEDGVIFCSIDDRNQAYVKCLFDEIFGERNFVENFIWIKNSTKNLSKTTSTNHEYILCYSKNKEKVEEIECFRHNKQGIKEVNEILEKATQQNWSSEKTEKELKDFYKQHKELKGITMYDRVELRKDDHSGQMRLKVYTLDNASAPTAIGQGATYDVIHPKTGLPCVAPTRGWAYTRQSMDEHIKNNLIYFYDDEKHVPRFKRFLDTVETEVMKSTFQDFTDGKKELMRIFDTNAYFSNPKPTTLIKKFLETVTKQDDIVLDFFAGSGTTGQAVLEQNKEDGGRRKFILVQYPENLQKGSIQETFCKQ